LRRIAKEAEIAEKRITYGKILPKNKNLTDSSTKKSIKRKRKN
jgi:hypothetical protein